MNQQSGLISIVFIVCISIFLRFCVEYATKDEFENKRKFKEKLEQIPDNDLSFKLNKENDVHVKKIFKETTEKNI